MLDKNFTMQLEAFCFWRQDGTRESFPRPLPFPSWLNGIKWSMKVSMETPEAATTRNYKHITTKSRKEGKGTKRIQLHSHSPLVRHSHSLLLSSNAKLCCFCQNLCRISTLRIINETSQTASVGRITVFLFLCMYIVDLSHILSMPYVSLTLSCNRRLHEQ